MAVNLQSKMVVNIIQAEYNKITEVGVRIKLIQKALGESDKSIMQHWIEHRKLNSPITGMTNCMTFDY